MNDSMLRTPKQHARNLSKSSIEMVEKVILHDMFFLELAKQNFKAIVKQH